MQQEGDIYSFAFDGRGNVTVALNISQGVAASYAYDAFGRLNSRSGHLEQPFRFATKAYDDSTGLSDFGFRFYAAGVGRWVSRDPQGEQPDLNLYAFVHNDPVNRFDPLGHSDAGCRFDKCMENCMAQEIAKNRQACKPVGWLVDIAGCLGGAGAGATICLATGYGVPVCAVVGCVAGWILPDYLRAGQMACEAGANALSREHCARECQLELLQ